MIAVTTRKNNPDHRRGVPDRDEKVARNSTGSWLVPASARNTGAAMNSVRRPVLRWKTGNRSRQVTRGVATG